MNMYFDVREHVLLNMLHVIDFELGFMSCSRATYLQNHQHCTEANARVDEHLQSKRIV
jgi:hypothetical protein